MDVKSWTIKKAEHWRIDAFELWCWKRLLRALWTYKEIKSVNPKGNQSWIFIGRADVEDETPILWPSDAKDWLIWKDPDAGKDWRQKEKGMTEDKLVGWHHRLDGHELKQALGVVDGQGSLVCCSLWGHKEPDTTEQLNWLIYIYTTYIHVFLNSDSDLQQGLKTNENSVRCKFLLFSCSVVSLPWVFLRVRSLRIQSDAETVGSGTSEICGLED